MEKTYLRQQLDPTPPAQNTEQIKQIMNTFNRLVSQNLETLKRIENNDPCFQYKLFNPKISYGFSWRLEKQLKLNQIEKLLEERQVLAKYQHYGRLNKQFCQEDQARILGSGASEEFRYGDLRNLWRSVGGKEGLSCIERIDDLNKTIKQITSKVESELAIQKNQIRFPNKIYSNTCSVGSKTFWKLQQRLLEMEQHVSMITQQNITLKKIIMEKQEQIKAVSSQAQQLKHKLQLSTLTSPTPTSTPHKPTIPQPQPTPSQADKNNITAVPNQIKNLTFKYCRSSSNLHQHSKYEQNSQPTQTNLHGNVDSNWSLNRVSSLASFYSDSVGSMGRVIGEQVGWNGGKNGGMVKKYGGRRWERTSVKKYKENERFSVATTSTGQNL